MEIRGKMREWRKKNDKTLQSLSIETGISMSLLETIEEGGVTHPEIAKRIAKAYELSDEEAKLLMPKNIEPPCENRYKIIIKPRIKDEGILYAAQHQQKGQR